VNRRALTLLVAVLVFAGVPGAGLDCSAGHDAGGPPCCQATMTWSGAAAAEPLVEIGAVEPVVRSMIAAPPNPGDDPPPKATTPSI
jgi:hypothetical protein